MQTEIEILAERLKASEATVGKLRDHLTAELATVREELHTCMTKLDAGTLHVAYCNGNPNERVGKDGLICNCTLGQEIKELRSHNARLRAALEELHEAVGIARAILCSERQWDGVEQLIKADEQAHAALSDPHV